MKSDFQLQQDVVAELKWDRAILKRQIGLEVRDGVVTLSGHDNSWLERNDALDSAWAAPGVLRVNDQLTIAA
jgi:osmotically-inducible protein OsmY